MLRTSLRTPLTAHTAHQAIKFLSSNAQDFIEDGSLRVSQLLICAFLSSNAQDFIEERPAGKTGNAIFQFLSSNAQDFIEERTNGLPSRTVTDIPEQ